MILVIKGIQYENLDWRVTNGIGEIRLHSEESFSEISAKFALNAGDSILQLNDNEQQIGEWYIESMASIQLPGEDGSDVVTIKYHISQIGKDAQEALTEDLDMASLSVLELAGIVANAKQEMLDTVKRVEQAQQVQNESITTMQRIMNQLVETTSHWESMYNILADRVAQLENK